MLKINFDSLINYIHHLIQIYISQNHQAHTGYG